MSGTARKRKGTARLARAATWGAIAVLLLGLVTLVLFPDFRKRGPEVAREIWSLVGVRRVEGYAPEIRAAAAESAVDPCLLAGVMYAESHGRADVVSSRGALGAFQLMPSAAGDAARKLRLPEPTREALLSDVLLGARLAANHLAWLIEHEGTDIERVLVAYNAGRTKLRRWIDAEGSYEAWRETRLREGGSGTLAYARGVISMRDRFRERGEIAPALAPLGGSAGDWTVGLPD
jgi:soluble lytic murein transglycosylase